MARKKKAGSRYPNGRLKQARDPGNIKVQALRQAFAGRAAGNEDLHCAIGVARAAGLLEGEAVSGRALSDHGREWCRLHRAFFGPQVRTVQLERGGGPSEPSTATSSDDLRYRVWARIVASLSPAERSILNLVCLEHGDTWELPPFLERLVHRPQVAGVPRGLAADLASLGLLRSALVELATATAPRRKRSPRPV